MTQRQQPTEPRESSKLNTSGMLKLFVYGTLKRGYWNHDPFCQGVLKIREAQVCPATIKMRRAMSRLGEEGRSPTESGAWRGGPRPRGDCVTVCFRRGQFVPSQRELSDLTEQQRAILELLDQSDRSIISAERRNSTQRKARTRSAVRGYHAAGLTTTRFGCSFTPSHIILATSCAPWRYSMQWNNGH